MPRRKNTKPETIDELLEEMETAETIVEEEIKNSSSEKPEKEEPEPDNTEKKRDEILKLAENGDLDKSVAYIKKASSQKVINKLYIEYERKRMENANDFLTDLLISKFANALGGFDAIESPDVLSKELQRDELLKRDVYSLVEKITPFIPFLGILSGGITTAKHVYDHKSKKQEEGPKE